MSILLRIVFLSSLFSGCEAFATSRASRSLLVHRPSGHRQARCGIRAAVSEVGSTAEFDDAIKEAGGDKVVVVDFSTTWCGPCKVMEPKFVEMSGEYDGVFLKCVGDSSAGASALMKREGVRSVPAFHFWKGGERVDVINGANLDALTTAIQKWT